ncbi:MAG: hypothetical protein ABIP35_07925 [Ginsengibacter sp.]
MKRIILLLHVLSLYSFGFSQCVTTEDANNTVSSCKFGGGIGTEDSRTSNTIVTQAQKWLSSIFTTVMEPAVKKTKGLRGASGGRVGITKDDGLTPYEMYSYMQELGCTTSQKLYEKDESGVKILFKINSLSGIATAITHDEYVLVKKSYEKKEVFDKVNGRQVYLLEQPTESERYAGFTYYRKEDNGDKNIVVAKDGIPLFLPVSIKDVLQIYRTILTVNMNQQNKQYTDIIDQGEEGYLAQMDLPAYEKNFGKEAAQKAKADYIKTYQQYVEGSKKMIKDDPNKKWISTIDAYLNKSSATQLARPCIVRTSENPGYNPITDAQFFDEPFDGMQYVTINPAYSNIKDPTTPQFVIVNTAININAKSATTLTARKDFEDVIDFKKLAAILSNTQGKP